MIYPVVVLLALVTITKAHLHFQLEPNPVARADVHKRSDGYSLIGLTYLTDITLGIGSDNQSIFLAIDISNSSSFVLGSEAKCYEQPDEIGSLSNVTSISNGVDYTSTATSPYCRESDSFNTDASDTFEQEDEFNWYSPYNNYDFENGVWAHDSISFGNTTLDNVLFGVIKETNDSPYWGKLGLGFQSDEHSFLNQLKSQGLIQKLVYVLSATFLELETFSTLLFGAVDHSRYSGQLKTVPMVEQPKEYPDSFAVILSNISATSNNKTTVIDTSRYTAVFSSVYLYLFVPEQLFHEIGHAFNGEYDKEYEDYIVPCNSSTSMELNFNGIKIPISHETFVWDSNKCTLNVYPTKDDTILIGSLYMDNGYFVFDLEDRQVSMAPIELLIDADSDIETIVSTIPSATRVQEAFTSSDDESMTSITSSQESATTTPAGSSADSTTTTPNDTSAESSTNSSGSGIRLDGYSFTFLATWLMILLL